jgi:hypothetical protein
MCAPGFQLSFANNMGICVNCTIPNCLSCNMTGSVPVCAVCALGYSPVLLGEACSQCSFPCATCNSTELQIIAKPVPFHSFLSSRLQMEFVSKTTFEDVSNQTQTTLPYAEHAHQDSL